MDLHRFVDKVLVGEAISAAERLTTAPLHVSIAPYFWGRIRPTAERAFRKHHLEKTPDRNGVLFFVVPSRREFVIVGDSGAHEALGQEGWNSAALIVQEHFIHGDPTTALRLGIESLSRALAEHFPADA